MVVQLCRAGTYSITNVDIDTCRKKVVDMFQPAMPTCLQQLHLLGEEKDRARNVTGLFRANGLCITILQSEYRVQSASILLINNF